MSDQQAIIDRLRQLLREGRQVMAEIDLLRGERLEILLDEMDQLEALLDPNEMHKLLDELV